MTGRLVWGFEIWGSGFGGWGLESRVWDRLRTRVPG